MDCAIPLKCRMMLTDQENCNAVGTHPFWTQKLYGSKFDLTLRCPYCSGGVSIGFFFEIGAINSSRSTNWNGCSRGNAVKISLGAFSGRTTRQTVVCWWRHLTCLPEIPPPRSSRSSYWCSPWLCQHWHSSLQLTVVCYIKRERGRWVKVGKRRSNVEDQTFTFYSCGRLFWKNLDFAE